MKKVCFVIDSLGGGGAENILVNLVNNLDKSIFNITILTFWSGGELEKNLSDEIQIKSIDPFKNIYMKRILYFCIRKFMPIFIINKLFLDNRYDVCVAYLEGLSTKLVSKTKLLDGEKYAWVHIDLVKQNWVLKYYKNLKQQELSYLAFNHVFAVSEQALNSFKELFPSVKNISLQHNFVDNEKVEIMANEENVKLSTYTNVISVGRLNFQKGYDRLLRVTAKLFEQGIIFQLYIVGQGNLLSELQDYANELGIHEHVHFLGFQSNPYKYVKAADIFVCSSRAEGFSTVITEALILGKPIVSTNCAGVEEQLGLSEFGIVTENTEDDLFVGLKKIICDNELQNYYKNLAKQRAEAFNKSSVIKQYESILKEGKNNE